MQRGLVAGNLPDIVVDRVNHRPRVAKPALEEYLRSRSNSASSALTASARVSAARWRMCSSCQAFEAARFSALVIAPSKRAAPARVKLSIGSGYEAARATWARGCGKSHRVDSTLLKGIYRMI